MLVPLKRQRRPSRLLRAHFSKQSSSVRRVSPNRTYPSSVLHAHITMLSASMPQFVKVDCDLEVTWDAASRARLASAVADPSCPLSLTLFDGLQAIVEKQLAADSMPRLIHSPEWAALSLTASSSSRRIIRHGKKRDDASRAGPLPLALIATSQRQAFQVISSYTRLSQLCLPQDFAIAVRVCYDALACRLNFQCVAN